MKFLKSTFLTALLALIGGAVYAGGFTARAYYTQNGNTVTFYNDSSSSYSGNHTLTWHFGDRTTYYTVTADNGILDVVELEESLLNKTLIRISGSVGLRYALTKSWEIRSSYQYGYGINSMLKSYDQLPQTNAIQFGVEYKIK